MILRRPEQVGVEVREQIALLRGVKGVRGPLLRASKCSGSLLSLFLNLGILGLLSTNSALAKARPSDSVTAQLNLSAQEEPRVRVVLKASLAKSKVQLALGWVVRWESRGRPSHRTAAGSCHLRDRLLQLQDGRH